jgi:hypothetical protein
VVVSRDETVDVDKRQRAESVVLHFEQPVGMIEGFGMRTSGIGRSGTRFQPLPSDL